MKRTSAPTLVFCLGIGLLALAPGAFAQSADLVLCDRVAADPGDPDKPADVKGVSVVDPSDVATAIKFCRAASVSSRRALYQLGRAHAANKQVSEAIAAYRKAIEKGSTAAMIELGVMYGTGAGVAKDPAEARKLFERAAAAGNPRGMTNVAALSSGGSIPTNSPEARGMLGKAADGNSAEAQFQLGIMNAEGLSGPKDEVAARALFEKAAAQNHPGALEWLGAFAQYGLGGPTDKAAAKRYYEKAIALGNENAKVALRRLECPYMLKDKQGKEFTTLCF